MNVEQVYSLSLRETDLEGAIKRFCGDEQLYIKCLGAFLEDSTMEGLIAAVDSQQWDEAFTAAHALKGVAGNMGFIPLMHAISRLVVVIRGGRLSEVDETMTQVISAYRDITDAIRQNF